MDERLPCSMDEYLGTRIRERAYELSLQGGTGDPMSDWIEARRQVSSEGLHPQAVIVVEVSEQSKEAPQGEPTPASEPLEPTFRHLRCGGSSGSINLVC